MALNNVKNKHSVFVHDLHVFRHNKSLAQIQKKIQTVYEDIHHISTKISTRSSAVENHVVKINERAKAADSFIDEMRIFQKELVDEKKFFEGEMPHLLRDKNQKSAAQHLKDLQKKLDSMTETMASTFKSIRVAQTQLERKHVLTKEEKLAIKKVDNELTKEFVISHKHGECHVRHCHKNVEKSGKRISKQYEKDRQKDHSKCCLE